MTIMTPAFVCDMDSTEQLQSHWSQSVETLLLTEDSLFKAIGNY